MANLPSPHSTTLRQQLKVVVYEGEGAKALENFERYALALRLLEEGIALSFAGNGPSVETDGKAPLLVVGRFEAQPATPQSANVRLLNIDGLDSEAAVQAVLLQADKDHAERKAWKPWFPVIDYTRCTNCMQCLSFCLFDVYGVSKAEKIDVQNPTNCKTDCPACSRVCPEVAIMFPKYKHGPINGDIVAAADLEREKMKIDISSLLGGDIYKTLRSRSEKAKSRFSKERDEDKALKERQRCLKKLQADFDIPDEVLNSLPSEMQIAAKFQASLPSDA